MDIFEIVNKIPRIFLLFRIFLYIFSFAARVVNFYRDLSAFLGGAYAIQYFFAGTSIVAFFFALLFLPGKLTHFGLLFLPYFSYLTFLTLFLETHGKKLSEIEDYFRGKRRSSAGKTTKPKKPTNNRKPKQTLQTVNESEKMMNGAENV